MLSTAASIQMWQQKTVCLIPLFAWTGDHTHMWYVVKAHFVYAGVRPHHFSTLRV